MKKVKTTLIAGMIALGALLFGQSDKVQYIAADYTAQSSRFENPLRNFLSRTARTERAVNNEPLVYMSFTLKQAEVVYEESYDTEAWMATPFESNYADADLLIESWMTKAFESNYAEADLLIESWMTKAFESNYAEADIEIESWMTAAF